MLYRAAIEEKYAKCLAKLARATLGKDEIGCVPLNSTKIWLLLPLGHSLHGICAHLMDTGVCRNVEGCEYTCLLTLLSWQTCI